MCGICGIVWKQSGVDDGGTIRRMNRAMTHRGPDDEGYFTDQTTQLAMRRLSIIDVAGGRQPITTDDGRHTVVFNGEIYNFQAVRDDLTRLGHRFHTLCDTEVVLHAFVEWGPDSLQRLRGMFALAIWDRDTKELFCARDRLGIKPFLFAETSQWFGFA
ncbi:MAG: asparagine synthetase B, partial [Candidatus Latescibacteria bacterium]|nr:asparagine synthetase B [Candidatus Latescibacterota bacterium]